MRRAALAARLAALVFRWSIRLSNNLPAWLQGESKDTPCPAMYKVSSSQLPVSSSLGDEKQATGQGKLVTGNWKLETDLQRSPRSRCGWDLVGPPAPEPCVRCGYFHSI
jgi:hypothetical protein